MSANIDLARKRHACAPKRKYATELAASASAVRALHNGRASYLRVYRCKHCQQWHLTKQEPAT